MQEEHDVKGTDRRGFLKLLATGAAAAAAVAPTVVMAAPEPKILQVWSCGGLAEAMCPAHAAFRAASGVTVNYTGAFAGALGKTLLGGGSTTEVFAGRVLALAKNLRKNEKMLYFKPLCFTTYGIAVPKGNPAGIKELADLTKKNVRVSMAPLASPPGGQAVMGILKNAGILKEVMPHVLDARASCVQRSMQDVLDGRADAIIVERRVVRIPRFAPHVDFIDIPEQYFPAGPLTFTVGVMQAAQDKALAESYVKWITSADGQAFFEKAGFIPAISAKGQELVEKLGVKDAQGNCRASQCAHARVVLDE